MDILLKQRLVGAIVLISLAVIFIPMLLSGNSELMSSRIKSNIPPQPSYEIRRLEIQPLENPANSDSISAERRLEKTPQSAVVETPQSVKVETPQSAKVETPQPVKVETPQPAVVEPIQTAKSVGEMDAQNEVIKPVPEVTAPAKAQEIKTPTQQVPIVKKTDQEKESSNSDVTNDIAVVTSWIVQIGSFVQEPNALSLRDKLQKKGFASFVTEAKTQSGNVYRVRVGPELNRELADNLRKKINKQYQLDGIVMRYP